MKTEGTSKFNQTDHIAILPLADGDAVSRHLDQLSKMIAVRAYELFERNGSRHGHELEDWYQAESQFVQPVPIEQDETDHNVTVRATISGFDDGRLEVHVGSHRLVISGKKNTSTQGSRDNHPTEICRRIDLSSEVDAARASATIRNGRLEVTLPKATATRKGPIAVKAA